MTSAVNRTAQRQSFTARLRKLESAFADLAKQFATLATVARESDEALCETFDEELKSRPTSTEVVAMIEQATRPKKSYDAAHQRAADIHNIAHTETVPTTSEGAE